MNNIQVNHVSKTYGNTEALKDINLIFKENTIYGLLGRNGAGKSTLINIITNRIFPSEGEVLINDSNIVKDDAILSHIYSTCENTYFPEYMKVKEVLKWTSTFYPDFDMNYANTIASQFGLNPNKKVKALSTGYVSILKLVAALSSNAEYMIFDEPVLGLDANNRDLFYKLLIEKYSENPFTIIISTHLIEEISNIIEDIIIIKDGKIIENSSRDNLLANGYTVSGTATAVDSFIADKDVIGCDSLGGLKTAYINGKRPTSLPAGLEISKLDLQKLFIQLTNSTTGGIY